MILRILKINVFLGEGFNISHESKMLALPNISANQLSIICLTYMFECNMFQELNFLRFLYSKTQRTMEHELLSRTIQ